MTKNLKIFTISGTGFEWPSETILPLASDTAALVLQMNYFLSALRETSASFGIEDEQ